MLPISKTDLKKLRMAKGQSFYFQSNLIEFSIISLDLEPDRITVTLHRSRNNETFKCAVGVKSGKNRNSYICSQ